MNNRSNTHQGSAGIPLGYDYNASLRASMSNSTLCFGGKLFLSQAHDGSYIICHAIQSQDDAFIQYLSSWYHFTDTLRQVPFLSYRGSSRLSSSEVVFTFSYPAGKMYSLRELMTSSNHQTAAKNLHLFEKLVELLAIYHSVVGEAHYEPLASISLDTVFVDENSNLHLLPLRTTGRYPFGYPMEAGSGQMSDRTDLYTAALVTVQVTSGCEQESIQENRRMRMDLVSDVVRSCLCVFPSGRPALTAVSKGTKSFCTSSSASNPGPSYTTPPKSPRGSFAKGVADWLCDTVSKVAHPTAPKSDVVGTKDVPIHTTPRQPEAGYAPYAQTGPACYGYPPVPPSWNPQPAQPKPSSEQWNPSDQDVSPMNF